MSIEASSAPAETQLALEQSRRLISAILESVTDALLGLDRQWRIVYINDAMLNWTRRRREDVVGRDFWEVYPVYLGSPVEAALREAMQRLTPTRIEGIGLHTGRWYESMVYPSADGISVFSRDTEERKQAEEALHAIQRQLQTVTDSMAAAVVRCSRDHRYVWVSRGYAEWLGMTPQDIAGRPIPEVMGEAAYATIRPYINRVLAGEKVDYEAGLDYRDVGRRWIHAVYVPLFNASGGTDGWVAVITDITRRRELENALREADRRKDEFLATLAHELRNPLAPIRSAVEILRSPAASVRDQEAAREIIDRQVGQMARLVDDLLDISRITQNKLSLRKERIELACAVEAALETSRPLIDAARHELTVSMPAEPIVLDADRTRLAQMIANLLNNAAKYTEPGGRIWLSVEQTADQAVISVRDTGIGISPQHLPQIFEMFSQVTPALERAQGGLGIGLALVRGLAELHGGRVEAASDGPGRGSEFIVCLPVHQPAGLRGPHGRGPHPGPAGAARRILVVDDNYDAAKTLATVLRLRGHETHTAHDGVEALQAAGAFQPEIVLLDIGLPRLNGYAVAEQLRGRPEGRKMVLVALTGWGQEDDKRRSRDAGFDHHLTKPVGAAALEALFDSLASREPRAGVV